MQVGGRKGAFCRLAIGSLMVATVAGIAAPLAQGAGGLEYVVSGEKMLRAGKTAAKRANCPTGTKVTGGGVVIVGGNTATAIRSSFPFDDNDGGRTPEDGWLGVALSRSAGDKELVTIAVCSTTGQLSYVDSEVVMGTGPTTLYAECPGNRRLAGGGVELVAKSGAGEDLVAMASVPYDTGGSAKPEAWSATGNNQTLFFGGMRTYAICAKVGAYRYVERSDTAPVGTQFGLSVPCPGGTKVTAGGADAGSTDYGAELARLAPFQDGGTQPDDGWSSAVNNNTSAPINFSAWTVCLG